MSLDSNLSRRFDLLCTLPIAGLVVLHVPPAVDIPLRLDGRRPRPGRQDFPRNVLFRGTVPVLGVISGFLLFRRRERDHSALVRRRVRTLLVPFLLWNIPGARAVGGLGTPIVGLSVQG